MVACRETNYSLEWNGHVATALKVGVDPKVLDVVRTSGALTGLDEKDAAVIRFGRQMFRDKKMEPATFAKVVELFGRKGAMDMVAVMNTYAVSGFYAIAVDERAAGRTAGSAVRAGPLTRQRVTREHLDPTGDGRRCLLFDLGNVLIDLRPPGGEPSARAARAAAAAGAGARPFTTTSSATPGQTSPNARIDRGAQSLAALHADVAARFSLAAVAGRIPPCLVLDLRGRSQSHRRRSPDPIRGRGCRRPDLLEHERRPLVRAAVGPSAARRPRS